MEVDMITATGNRRDLGSVSQKTRTSLALHLATHTRPALLHKPLQIQGFLW